MTVPAHIAERDDFRQGVAAMPAPDRPTEAATAARAARTSAQHEGLRPWNSAVTLLRDYGVALPPALDEARAMLRDARLAARDAVSVTTADALADGVLDAADLTKGIAAASKTRAADLARAEIARALTRAAERRAVRVVRENLAAIGDAVLGSERVAAHFAEVERRIVDVPASALAHPRDEDLANLANVAALRHAASVFDPLLVRLASAGIIWAAEVHYSALFFADPAEADPIEVSRALRALRPGVPDMSVWQTAPEGHAVFAPLAPAGVPAAILAGTRGVTIRPALTVEEFESRLHRVYTTSDSAPVIKPSASTTAPLVF